jgi:hypothetical protein
MLRQTPLIFGDVIVLVIITIIGFVSHGEAELSFVPRMSTTFIPLLIGWFLIAPWLGLFNEKTISDPRQLWRPPFAMLLAAPMAAVLRATMLNTAALPLFTLILGSSAALGLLLWRGLRYLLTDRKRG